MDSMMKPSEKSVSSSKHSGHTLISYEGTTGIIRGVHEDDATVKHRQISVLVIGAGARGNVYSTYASEFPHLMKVVGVAEPRETRRTRFQTKYSVINDNTFTTWEEAASREKFADAVVITTLDDLHYAPCVAFADLGYHILCEKPMACCEEECVAMVDAAKRNDVMLAFGHVMRYTNEYLTVKRLIDNGEIGELVGIDHQEPIGWWHFAHSYVRGNWKKGIKQCGSLMAKSCHDMDLIKHFLGSKKCVKIQSFGGLFHFKAANKPKNASDRCLDCQIEESCPYSAVKQYINPVKSGRPDQFCNVVCDDPDIENLTEALRNGPYGQCVYSSDNDVCDHQTVTMGFENCTYVTFTMSAFTKDVCKRKIRIFGTTGQIECNGPEFTLFDFRTGRQAKFKPSLPKEATSMRGHGYADYHLMKAFVKAVALGDSSILSSGPEDSLRGHKLVFAAERSRKLGGVTLEKFTCYLKKYLLRLGNSPILNVELPVGQNLANQRVYQKKSWKDPNWKDN